MFVFIQLWSDEGVDQDQVTALDLMLLDAGSCLSSLGELWSFPGTG